MRVRVCMPVFVLPGMLGRVRAFGLIRVLHAVRVARRVPQGVVYAIDVERGPEPPQIAAGDRLGGSVALTLAVAWASHTTQPAMLVTVLVLVELFAPVHDNSS